MSDNTNVAAALMDVQQEMGPFYDAADGMRRELESRGWSPAMAEHLAATWLQNAITAAWQTALAAALKL